jgi:glycogen operon protein
MLKCRVVDTAFTWGGDQRPDVPWHESVLYETHLRGFTMLHPDVPERYRGTAAGFSIPQVIDHLKALGVTAVEFLPVHAFVQDRHLVERKLANFWGYNTIGFFAPEPRYLATGDLAEWKAMVRCLHEAGIEVMVDVVYNHTAEGNHLGPTLSFKGIDNASYYRLVPGEERFYWDSTGCGNTVNLSHPRVLQMVMDSLRHWVEVMGVDGFRFDLTSTLARDHWNPEEKVYGFDDGSGFLDAVRQDPVLNKTKLIAEPWDLAGGGYRVGRLPAGLGRVERQVPRHRAGATGRASRATSPSSRPGSRARPTCWPTPAGGPAPASTWSPPTTGSRCTTSSRTTRSTTRPTARTTATASTRTTAGTAASRGRPTTPRSSPCGTGRSATCWPRCSSPRACRSCWRATSSATARAATTTPTARTATSPGSGGTRRTSGCSSSCRSLVALRRQHPVFRRPYFFRGEHIRGTAVKDIVWLNPEGREQRDDDWGFAEARTLGFLLGGDAGELFYSTGGRQELDDGFIVLMSSFHEPVPFTLPPDEMGRRWTVVLDTAREDGDAAGERYEAGSAYPLEPRSLVVLTRPRLVERLVEAASPAAAGQPPTAGEIPRAPPPVATSGPVRHERELAEAGEAS